MTCLFAYVIIFVFFIHKGRNVESVEVPGDQDFYTLSRLQPDVEYIVTIIPLYEGNTEGLGAPARFKLGRCSYSSLPLHGTCTAPSAISKLAGIHLATLNCLTTPALTLINTRITCYFEMLLFLN